MDRKGVDEDVGPFLNAPSWSLGSTWPEALAQEYPRLSGLVPVEGALLKTPQFCGCSSGLVLSLAPFFLGQDFLILPGERLSYLGLE